MEEINRRRAETITRIDDLATQLKTSESLIAGKACVYATGSFGRREASIHSDLDLFIISRNRKDGNGEITEESALRRLDEICLKADLIQVTKKLGIPEFDGDGRYLLNYTILKLTDSLGKEYDDAENTFTARLLLLLESHPLLGKDVYEDLVSDVIAAYWGDYEDHKENFSPAFLCNDILRLWRTFCVNYEARTERQPLPKKLKRKAKNYKLKYSRLLTCYSGLLYLLATYRAMNTVSPEDAIQMNRFSPTERLSHLLDRNDLSSAHPHLERLLTQYDRFLVKTNMSEADLVKKFEDRAIADEYSKEGNDFGETMYLALNAVGEDTKLLRLLVV